MDFSRSRGWRAANNSTLSNSSNGSGPLMVKTYGRFRQRIVNRETKGAEEFARATSVRPILADLLGSSSSDSDFEDKTPDSVSSTDRGPSEPKDATKNIKSKAKKPPTKDAAKPGSKSAPKPKSKRGASAKPKNDVLVDEQQETVAASETSHIDTTDTPVIKVAELPSQLSTQTATTKSHTAKPKHKSVAKDENQDTVSALKVDDKLAKSKPKPKAKSKAKSKTKPKPKDVEKGKTKRAPSVENTMVVDEASNSATSNTAIDKESADSVVVAEIGTTLQVDIRASCGLEMDADINIDVDADANAKANCDSGSLIGNTQNMATNGASTPATTLERPEHEHEHGPVSVPESEREPEPESDAMQVDNEAPGPLVNGNADSAELLANSKLDTPTRKNPNFASHHRELPATLQMSGVGSNNLLVAPSPISSGRVTKRRAIRQKQSALAGKQASKAGSSMQVVAQEDDRMSLDSFALRPLVRLPRQSTPRPSPATQLEEIQALNLPDPPSPLFLKRKSSDVDMDMPLLKARSLTPEAPHKVQEVASLDIDGIAEVDFEEEDDDQQQQHQQLIGTKPMRFKAPKNARVQTFEIDEDDQQPEQHHALLDKRMSTDASATQSLEQEETQSYFSTPVKTAASNISMYPQTPTAQALYPNGDATDRLQMTPMRTPQRKAMGGAADEMPLGAPHSPARMVTPHRVVYSPVNPRTVMKSRKSTVMDTDALDQQKIPQTPAPAKKSAVSTPAALPTTAKAKSNSRTSDQIEPGMSGRRSTVGGDLEPEFEETRVPFLPARRYVQKAHIFAACGQTAPIDWATGGLQACGVLLPEIDPANHTEAQMSEIESEAGLCKIGEATYSEVFSAQWRYVPRTRYDKFNSKKGKVKGERLMQVALKVIPFGNSAVKLGTGEPQTTLRDLYQEIGATLALSRLSERERAKLQDARLQVKMPLKPKERELGANFVKAFRVCICQGSLPAPLLRAWDRWKTEYPDLCENIRPDYYPANQLFAVFVLEMGGETLENATVSTWKEARSIIRQLALSMALAERNNRFEHRDLHWGNIMVTRYNSNLTFLYQLPPIGSRQKSTLLSIPSYKLRCTIIDYTLSRLHIDNDTADIADSKQPANYNPANNVFYVALKDEALFRGKGDIQFDVYRQMRECSKAQWDGFHPHTNVLWLTYVLQKILLTKSPNIRNELMSFAESKLGPSFAAAPTELKRAASQELLRRWVSEFEKCESSSQVLKCALLDLYKGQ